MTVILSGNSHPEFAAAIRKRLGLPECKVNLSKFANGESSVEIEVSLRDRDVFIVQTGYGSVNDNFIELLIMIHAAKIASAKRITAVVPCFPYSRVCSLSGFTSSEQVSPRRKTLQKRLFQEDSIESIDAEYEAWPVQSNVLVAKMVMTSGADHVITMDMHDPQFQGFFDIPVDNLPSLPMMVKCIQQEWPNIEDIVIVSPDAGGAKRATTLADALDVDFALVHQDRKSTATSMLVGEVKGKIAILLDDIVDTSETLVRAADLLFDRGAKEIVALITHGIFAPGSVNMINRSRISKLFVSNTIPQESHLELSPEKIKTFDVSGMFAEAIRRTHNGESVSFLYQPFAFL